MEPKNYPYRNENDLNQTSILTFRGVHSLKLTYIALEKMVENNPLTLDCTGCLLGILIMVYYNPYLIG